MKPEAFMLNKTRRLVETSGKLYIFKRKALNEYNEEVEGDGTIVAALKGVYHETRGYTTRNATDNAILQSLPQPMIFTTYEMAKDLKPEDLLTVGLKLYKVTAVRDVYNLGLVADISLEVVQNGVQV